MKKTEKIFQPMMIGNIEIKNRIAMAPMGIMGLGTPDGGFSKRAINYYVERAKGDVGLIITSVSKIENEIERFSMPSFPCVTMNPMHFISTASELTERVHSYGSKIFLQLAIGFGRVAAPQMLIDRPIAPSAIPNYWDPTVTCRELTTEEVESLVKKAGESAEIAAASGFDGVEIHAVHEGYLLDQFTIELFNRRRDKYGGTLEGRLNFPIEIVKEIKKRVGRSFPVSLRYSIKSYIKDWNQGGLPDEKFEERGRDIDEGLKVAKILEKAGYDAFDADGGSYDAWYWAHPPVYQKHGCYLPLTEKLKEVVSVPVLVAGRLDIPDLAKKVLNDGKAADMIVIGRGLLADPYWPKKVLRGETKRIRPCIGCQDGCLGRIFIGRPLSCAVNPACGREDEYGIKKSSISKKVMVIGGGVAGMEAARVSTIRGHKVTLYERSDKLGGHLIEASVPEFKNDVERLLKWYENELKELKVNIKLDTEVMPKMVLDNKDDVVIVATGSSPLIPAIDGIDSKNVITAIDALLGSKPVGNNVLVVGGGLIGCETALWLADHGKSVMIVDALGDLMIAGLPICHANRTMLIDLLKYKKVNILANTSLDRISDNEVVIIDKNFNKKTISSVDTVILATGLKPNNDFYKSLIGKIPNIYAIGDARKPQNIMYSIWDAYELCREL
ncbi:MAG TPA: FAD-dependent oxidoreductase [Halobacteria archaeon]|nr:FAD-dependent oxidoreductase [Halobacteria archaeon]